MSMGQRILEARTKRRWTQAQLVEKLRVSFQAISCWERDACLPETDKLRLLAETLGVSADVLPLLENLKNTAPDYANAVFLLRYQILSIMETVKRLL